jgi:acetyl-CoA C-acetyltransferase
MHNEVYIISAVRTPIGSFGGSLRSLSATELGAIAIKGALEKSGVNPEMIDEVIMGCVIQAGLGQAPARQAALKAGLSNNAICTTINKVCASGMKSVAIAAQNILLGDADVIIAGGMESMSNVPFYNMQQRWGNKYGDVSLLDGLAKDGLTDVYDNVARGNFADSCAKDNHISREEQVDFAIQSYK